MNRTTAIIAEDETVQREELRERLSVLWPQLEVVGMAADGADALALFNRHRPTVMFLDVEMPVLSGLDVARQIAGQCHIVFITAFDAYAVAAFEHGAIDYLLKPYEPHRLATAIQRVRGKAAGAPPQIEQLVRDLSAAAQPRRYLRWIKALRGTAVELILVDEVCYFQASSKYTTVLTADRETIIRTSIRALLESLDPERFWRINRGTIVHVDAIASVVHRIGGSMQIRLVNRPERLTVSEPHRHLFRHM